jgi:hypothetical protein
VTARTPRRPSQDGAAFRTETGGHQLGARAERISNADDERLRRSDFFREATRKQHLQEIERVLKVDQAGDGGTAAAVAAAMRYKACILRLAPDDAPQRAEALRLDPTLPVKDNAELRLRGLLIAFADDLRAGHIAPKESRKKVGTMKPSEDKRLHRTREDERYALLRGLYDAVEGSLRAWCDYFEVAEQLGVEDPQDRFTELYEQGLVKFMGTRGAMLTLDGQREVEQTKRDVAAGLVFAAPTVTNYNTTIHAHGGSSVIQQQGDHNTATINSMRADVAEALRRLREGLDLLPEEQREEAFELVKAIEIQATADAPQKTITKSYLRTLQNEYVPLLSDSVQLGQYIAAIAAAFGISL